MLRLTGALLLLAGTAGFARCLCRERKRGLYSLKEMKRMYQLFQSEIEYTGLPLPEIFRNVSEQIDSPFKETLLEICKRMTWERGENLADVWRGQMEICFEALPLKSEVRELAMRFPECAGFHAREGQAKEIDRFIREMDRWILQMEEEEKSKNKVIMSLGIAAGIFLIVILL